MKKYSAIDNSLLKLEKKLNNITTDEIIINKFILKPKIQIDMSSNKKKLNDLNEFLQKFKNSTEQLINDPKLVEHSNIENKINANGKSQQKIEMNLALGVLDIHENMQRNDDLMKKVIQNKSNINENESLNMILNDNLDINILQFLNSNRKRTRKIKKIHKKNKFNIQSNF